MKKKKQTILYYQPQEWKNPKLIEAGKRGREAQIDRLKEANKALVRQKALESLFNT